MKSIFSVAIILSVVAAFSFAQASFSRYSPANQESAEGTLRQYVELRLRWADWKEYSKFITWPDEPGWDCWWVASNYIFGHGVKRGDDVVVPVTYRRLGLFCANFQFESKPKTDTVRYKMVRQAGVWKVDGPIPDYPYLNLQVLRDWLANIAANNDEIAERRADARKALQILPSAAPTR